MLNEFTLMASEFVEKIFNTRSRQPSYIEQAVGDLLGRIASKEFNDTFTLRCTTEMMRDTEDIPDSSSRIDFDAIPTKKLSLQEVEKYRINLIACLEKYSPQSRFYVRSVGSRLHFSITGHLLLKICHKYSIKLKKEELARVPKVKIIR